MKKALVLLAVLALLALGVVAGLSVTEERDAVTIELVWAKLLVIESQLDELTSGVDDVADDVEDIVDLCEDIYDLLGL